MGDVGKAIADCVKEAAAFAAKMSQIGAALSGNVWSIIKVVVDELVHIFHERKELTADCKTVVTAWRGGDYESSGKAVGDIVGIIIGGLEDEVTALPPRSYTELLGGDCCPGTSDCKEGSGPYAVSTGGDYPEMSKMVCDRTNGCVAFGQMESFVTRFHFDSKEACLAARKLTPSIGFQFNCGGAVQSGAIEYKSVNATALSPAKMPVVCYTTAN